jgi:hypothetical protein
VHVPIFACLTGVFFSRFYIPVLLLITAYFIYFFFPFISFPYCRSQIALLGRITLLRSWGRGGGGSLLPQPVFAEAARSFSPLYQQALLLDDHISTSSPNLFKPPTHARSVCTSIPPFYPLVPSNSASYSYFINAGDLLVCRKRAAWGPSRFQYGYHASVLPYWWEELPM